MSYEWRLSPRRRLQLQEVIHRQCAPLQLNWKEINFNAFGQTREEQHGKAMASFRQTIDKHNIQFDTFRIQIQQKLNDIEATLSKLQTTSTPTTTTTTTVPKATPSPEIVVQKPTSDTPVPVEPTINIGEELARLRELLEETLVGQTEHSHHTGRRSSRPRPSMSAELHHDTQNQALSQNINDRVTDLQLSVNRLHQDVTAMRQVLERMSPLSTSLMLGRAAGRK